MKSKFLIFLFLICLLPLSSTPGQYLKRDKGRQVSTVPSVKVSPTQETYDSLDNHAGLINNLEDAADSINTNVSDNATAISTNVTDIGNLENAADSINTNVSDNASAIDALPTFSETGGVVNDSIDSFIVGGASTFNSMTGRQITHSLGDVDHFTLITQTDSSGYVGEIHVRKGTTVDTVFNSGSESTSAFMWIVFPNR